MSAALFSRVQKTFAFVRPNLLQNKVKVGVKVILGGFLAIAKICCCFGVFNMFFC